MTPADSNVDLVLLAEDQNATFDDEYHTPAEFAAKVATLKELVPGGPKKILDVGGGNGRFLDQVLEAFADAEGVLVDVSGVLLARNAPHPRKRLVEGSIGDLDQLVGAERFDVISINWVLHHLVGPTYEACRRNRAAVLAQCARFLAPGGLMVVTELMCDGPLNGPSHVIYAITRVRAPWFVRISRRFFNTAGVGVCFQSEAAWRRQFGEMDLKIVRDHFGHTWPAGLRQRLMLALLLLRRRRNGHFYLRPG